MTKVLVPYYSSYGYIETMAQMVARGVASVSGIEVALKRFGNMATQMRNFLDQTGRLWAQGKLIGKVGSVFTSSAVGDGNETTIISFWHTLAHHGMAISGLPYSSQSFTISAKSVADPPMARLPLLVLMAPAVRPRSS